MKYVSTRGRAPELDFEEVMLAGLARDGGLYVPQTWPQLSRDDLAAIPALTYPEAATRIMAPFMDGCVPQAELGGIVEAAYASFSHPAVAPLRQAGPGDWVLELFHGPTLAFKDVAMQVLARLMDRALKTRDARITIVVATSGDTGGAAVEAFKGRDAIDIFVLHPHGRVTDVQRRQMTTAPEDNVHNIAVRGTFDDCQALVKALFNDHDRRDRLSLAGVNSINWARIVAQVVYYITAGTALGAPHRAVSFSVPTGNFGDIFAGYVARAMGLPVERLVIATNVNDILNRTLTTGRYAPSGVVATSSPSMDIQVSSNFERLMFEASGRDPERVRAIMADLDAQGHFELEARERAAAQDVFASARVDEEETAAEMRRSFAETGVMLDPHTAVGHAAARRVGPSLSGPIVTLATADPAKFPDAVARACGEAPPVPGRLAAHMEAEERYDVVDNDYAGVAAHIEARARARAAAEPAS